MGFVVKEAHQSRYTFFRRGRTAVAVSYQCTELSVS
jgi:hypothetical protein